MTWMKNGIINTIDLISGGDLVSTKSTKEKIDQGLAQEESTPENKNLQDRDLDNVSGGAYPTAVNNQITDSVT
ncbi:MAG: hypothetical protein H6Q72_1487 [Firmicutes bacterium]|nr:hypothetical protein [Bacillota bacterium]